MNPPNPADREFVINHFIDVNPGATLANLCVYLAEGNLSPLRVNTEHNIDFLFYTNSATPRSNTMLTTSEFERAAFIDPHKINLEELIKRLGQLYDALQAAQEELADAAHEFELLQAQNDFTQARVNRIQKFSETLAEPTRSKLQTLLVNSNFEY